MRADELLVERYLQMEKKLAGSDEVIDDLHEMVAEKMDEIKEYENLIAFLQMHLKQNEFGVFFEFYNHRASHPADIEYLSSFFEINEVEEKEEMDELDEK